MALCDRLEGQTAKVQREASRLPQSILVPRTLFKYESFRGIKEQSDGRGLPNCF
jgi:hypothetical protein